jgi:hypothetical protein
LTKYFQIDKYKRCYIDEEYDTYKEYYEKSETLGIGIGVLKEVIQILIFVLNIKKKIDNILIISYMAQQNCMYGM